MEKSDRITALKEMLKSVCGIDYWLYDMQGRLRDTSSTELALDVLLSGSGMLKQLAESDEKMHAPMLLSSRADVIWGASLERNGDGHALLIHIIGPMVRSETTHQSVDEQLRALGLSPETVKALRSAWRDVPVISSIHMMPYLLMLHFCVTGEKMSISDVQFVSPSDYAEGAPRHADNAEKKERYQTWMADQALFGAIREGSLNFSGALKRASELSEGVRVHTKDPRLQLLLSSHAAVVKTVAAAIEGGMSPEAAYARGDSYLQSMIDAKTSMELAELNHAMFKDFANCVRRCRANPNRSKQVQACCDYIELHVEDKLTVGRLSQKVGYAENYLSAKFKKEMGVTIMDYISSMKIKAAQTLLVSTKLTVQEISDRLNYCSRGYFSQVFCRETGVTPPAYRKKYQPL